MSVFGAAERLRSSPVQSWTLAFVAFGVSLAARFLFDDVLPAGFPYLTFFPAVILTAFFAGLWPGIFCAVLGGLSAWYWFIPPFDSFHVNHQTIIALLFYACIVSVDIVLIELMHGATENLRAERAVTRNLYEQQREMVAQLKDREERQQVLQHELSHRMKNTLAIVQAVVDQSLRHAPDLKSASRTASARIMALGRSQDMLTQSNWQSADIRTIIDASLAPHVDHSARFRLEGAGMKLTATQSMGLALMLHELATNAAKYGALSNEAGHVQIAWTKPAENRFELTWRESGGPPVVPPTRRGFGSRLIERIVPGYFHGETKLDYAPGGLVVTLAGTVES
ncbi:DUF4118 domain-containing protein [Tianweitania sp. BSSL-BM11]|uniref:histidine kinase n=1 Tax=Tianweitania aestuarii TaxID=2814886 RepID=A0ABS5RYU2_9HYPH|nr:HWE histidine kinase domain-containing protein [Tianweitania aestuarii]MBS9721394.1 DUF4118 domain-containing protein [Tianweitania aestuarii]